jgi:hypothetical protein
MKLHSAKSETADLPNRKIRHQLRKLCDTEEKISDINPLITQGYGADTHCLRQLSRCI